MPAFMPPRISDDSLSPTMTALSRSKPSMRENTISKNFFVGLSAPSRSDMKTILEIRRYAGALKSAVLHGSRAV